MTPAALKRLNCHLRLSSPEPVAEHVRSQPNVRADKHPVAPRDQGRCSVALPSWFAFDVILQRQRVLCRWRAGVQGA